MNSPAVPAACAPPHDHALPRRRDHPAPSQLIQVFFVRDGVTEPRPIRSMPGQYQHTLESIIPPCARPTRRASAASTCLDIPRDEDKDEVGSTAWDPQGILNRAIAVCREEFGDDLVVMADTCLDEFTSRPLRRAGR